MKILIADDCPVKREEIAAYLRSVGCANGEIDIASDMADFATKFDSSIDLCVIDLRLPAYFGAPESQNGLGILQLIDRAESSRLKMLAVSAYPEEFEAVRNQFERRGCVLISFDKKDVWKSALKLMTVQARSRERKDFLIFCALREERAPYIGMDGIEGSAVFRDGAARFDFSLDGKAGSVIELPRAGLVDAATTTAVCIERFSPRLVAMSGICAGFEGRAHLGQLLISELAYEYQSGKWTVDGFSQEPYQIPIAERVRGVVRELIEDGAILQRLESNCTFERPTVMRPPVLASFTSGSAVIANEKLMEQVATYHRKVGGLDMEVYGLFRAAHLSKCKPDVLCAKVAVDMAGSKKSDNLHPYGCLISSRFMMEAISLYFERSKEFA